MTPISLWDPDRIWVSCKSCGQWSEAPVSSSGRAAACSNCRRPIEIPPGAQVPAPYSVVDEAAIARNRTDSSGSFFFLCPNCNRRFSFPDRAEGAFVKCSQCSLIMVVQRVIGISQASRHEIRPSAAEAGSSPISGDRCDVVLDRSRQEELRVKASGQEKCSYCEASFDDTESDYFCPECFLRFHEQCWIENQGCAAPGCKLQHVPKKTITIPRPPPEPNPAIRNMPWEYVLLLGTVILGIASFATTLWLNIIGAVLSFLVLKNENLRRGRTGVVRVCMAIAIMSFLFSEVIRSS